MPHELVLASTAIAAASNACNLLISGFSLILHAQSTRADEEEEEDIEAWAAGALQRRRALARDRRRRREMVVRHYKPPLPYKRFSFNLNLWADLWVEKRLRFTKAEIALILPYLRLDEIDWKVDGNGYRPSETKALAITLASLAFPLRQHDMIAWFGCSASQLSVIKNVVCCHLVTIFRDRLFWDRARLTMEKMREFAAVIDQHGGGDNIWGWIDGTVLRICRPTEGQRKAYSGHKKFHGYKFQGVITPDGMMASLAGPVMGLVGTGICSKKLVLRTRFCDSGGKDRLGERRDCISMLILPTARQRQLWELIKGELGLNLLLNNTYSTLKCPAAGSR